MTDELKNKIALLVNKIKTIKHIKYFIITGLALLIGVGYFLFIPKTSQESSSPNNDNISTTFSTSAEYISYLENKLESVITSVKGVGETEVIITLEKGFEYVFATEEETRTTSGGSTLTTTEIVIVDGQPVIQKEIYPVVQGIVIVADGAETPGVKLEILSLVQTIINIDSGKINIFAGN